MSDSDSDSGQIGAAHRRKAALFLDSDPSSPASSPQRQQPAARAGARAPTRPARAQPRFLGDSDGEEDGVTAAPFGFASRAVLGEVDDLFGELESVSNARRPPRAPSRPLESRTPAAAPPTARADPAGEDNNIDSVWQNGDGEGVDGVAIKQRRVVARMDEARLLGPTGFPELLKQVRKAGGAVRIKGKGHERQDLKRLLGVYQLWAHQMYPKFNLRDSLATVEKLCHKRAVQAELRMYREEEKARKKALEAGVELAADETTPAPAAAAVTSASATSRIITNEGLDDADLFDFDPDEEAMLAELEMEAGGAPAKQPQRAAPPLPALARKAVPEDDDLDAMEEEALLAAAQQGDFGMDEDEEAMLREMEGMA